MIVPDPKNPAAAGLQRRRALAVEFTYSLCFTEHVFHPDNPTLLDCLEPSPGRPSAVAFIDQGVLAVRPHLGEELTRYLEGRVSLQAPPQSVPGGEQVKNDRRVLDDILQAIDRARLCRQSYVLAIGGGAVQDVVGFAAATAHRGVRLIRLPSTTLSQTDSGVGVKNGINAFGKKNYLGTFSVPWAVINDVEFLRTLSDRDWRCGFSEAVKVALIKDAGFFEDIAAVAGDLASRAWTPARRVIERSCALHYDHIAEGGDPFELTEARPLDFGHWAAHRLEQLSGYRLRHGEAVAIGIAIDVLYSAVEGFLEWSAADDVLRCLRDLGFDLQDPCIRCEQELLEGIEEFREHLGGRLTIPMLRGLGDGFEVHAIDHDAMCQALQRLQS